MTRWMLALAMLASLALAACGNGAGTDDSRYRGFYGGVSGGTRSVQMTKQVVTTLKIMPLPEAVTIPFFASMLKDGVFHGSDELEKAIKPMLDELHKWAGALRPLRQG